ncbi:MAG: hypothetical protein UHN88_04910 [Eubacterium sp.]|nr:hypothetical protein [Eubacterium sp.]
MFVRKTFFPCTAAHKHKRSGSKKRRRTLSFCAVLFLLGIVLSGCVGGTHKSSFTNRDKTITRIEYKDAVPFARAPNFKEYDDHIDSTFNGRVMFTVIPITHATAKQPWAGTLVAQSSNIDVYLLDSLPPEYTFPEEPLAGAVYLYIMHLDGSTEGQIAFLSGSGPESHAQMTDFDHSIYYYLNGCEIVPDTHYVPE